RKRAALGRARDGEHADHALPREERDERRALRADRIRHALVDLRRTADVVDRHGRSLEDRARHSRGLALQIEDDLTPEVEVLAVPAGEQAPRLGQLVVDERQAGEVDAYEARDLVEEHARDRLGIAGAAERLRDRLDRLELP